MMMTKAVRQQLVLTWLGLGVGMVALGLLEVVLLDERVGLALGITAVVTLVVGALITRHLVVKHDQPLITVRDLRTR